jgi:glyoxylase-like metal-dependent hydrolase (beta-lactamase superfamily II)
MSTMPTPLSSRPSHPSRRAALLSLSALGALALAGRSGAQDFGKVEIQAVKLSDSVWMLTGAGGNLGLSVGPDAVFLIDDQFAPLAPKIKAAIAKITPKPVSFLLNTHFHFDHTGGNEVFGSDGALIVAHDNVRRRMSTDQLIALAGSSSEQKASPKVALPVVTVSGELRFHINGDELHAFHAPRAHTDGDLIVHFRKSDVFHLGDVFFNGFYPFIDVGSGGSPEGVVLAFDRVLALAGERSKIIPGHGPLASKADLQATRDMLATVLKRVVDLKRAGKTDSEVIAAKPSADFDARWGGGFVKPDAFIALVLGGVGR